jgi:hypothetical protein
MAGDDRCPPSNAPEYRPLYLALIQGGPPIWITAGGPSATPGPLSSLTPLSLAGLPLINTQLALGTGITILMFFAEGNRVITYDLISGVVQP